MEGGDMVKELDQREVEESKSEDRKPWVELD